MIESEARYRITANQHKWIAVSVLFASVLGLVGLYVFARDSYSENDVLRLIKNSYDSQRPGGGRLWKAHYSESGGTGDPEPDLAKAQLLLLKYADSLTKQQLQAMIYLASGNWQKYVDAVSHFPPQMRRDPEVLNNLGASLLSLSEEDPSNLLKALDQFQEASQLDSKAVEPRFNLAVTYRKLRLQRLADEASRQYSSIDRNSAWYRELSAGNSQKKSALIEALRHAVEDNDGSEAERLFEKDPDLFRNLANQYGTSNTEESPRLLRFIASELEQRYGDKTTSAMLRPLLSEKQQKAAIALRQFVTEGAELFVEEDLPGSLEAYRKAESFLTKTDSLFDRLWIDLNRVDTQIRAGQFDAARESLRRLVLISQKNGFLWLQAKALSIYGSTLRLTSSYGELMTLLAEADRMFAEMNASHDRVRVLYYRAMYQYGAGDYADALKLALECLGRSDDSDWLRMSSLDWLIGSILYRQQLPETAVLFGKESVEQTQRGHNVGMEALTASTLAQLYESMSRPNLAEQYLETAENAFKRMPAGFDQTRTELLLGILKARIELDRKQYAKAQSLLERNLEIYSHQPFLATAPLLSPSLMLLAKSYSETGLIEKAAQKFDEAIDVVENDDQYLQSEKLRIKFDDERRDLYDSAIDFAYNNVSPNAAWSYLQRYRSKLFIEFLAQFDPDVGEGRAQALDRSRVQALLPSDAQVVEYALLKNRLLIWVISKNHFVSRSVSVSRDTVETEVQDVLEKLRNRDEVDTLLTDLGKLLIEPVADLLDGKQTLVIVPDRALHGLPFGALRRPGKSQFLIEEFSILVSPNLTHLLLTKAVQPQRDQIIGFASHNGDSSELKELAAISEIYRKSETFAGRDADKSHFLGVMSRAAVLHYAGHSATDAVDPLRSSILLDGNRFGPNSVTAVDIAQQRLKKNALVVLSSCDSSVGNARDGVGMRGLTSAFLIGGAGSVVGSLWPVEASSTADLMIRFHRTFIDRQMPVANALREAQLTFLRSFPERTHPYYWSGFVVTGNFSALR